MSILTHKRAKKAATEETERFEEGEEERPHLCSSLLPPLVLLLPAGPDLLLPADGETQKRKR